MMKRIVPALMLIAFVLSGVICPKDCIFAHPEKTEQTQTAAGHDSASHCCPDEKQEKPLKNGDCETPMFMFECAGNNLASVKPFYLSAPNFIPVIISYAPEILFTPAETAQNTTYLAKPPPDYDIAAFYASPAPHISSTVLRI